MEDLRPSLSKRSDSQSTREKVKCSVRAGGVRRKPREDAQRETVSGHSSEKPREKHSRVLEIICGIGQIVLIIRSYKINKKYFFLKYLVFVLLVYFPGTLHRVHFDSDLFSSQIWAVTIFAQDVEFDSHALL